jgi:hypothetical protein
MGIVYYSSELKAIAALSDVPLGELVLMNLGYELFAACTSIVVEDKNGLPLHCRSMDWDLPCLKDMTLEVCIEVIHYLYIQRLT